jgi:hypothetical protein
MAVLAACSACGAALTTGECGYCGLRAGTHPTASRREAGAMRRHSFWSRFFVACVPAAVLALFVESTFYGYVLYVGVYLTYLAWAEATASPSPIADNNA